MKALSLWQPWASAIAIGAKQNETRSWSTPYRGPIAIHAAKKRSAELTDCFYGEYYQWFKAAGITVFERLPFGCVLLKCRLVDCVPVETIRGSISTRERAFGDYGDGRFAWTLTDIEVLPVPVPARGAQGFWNWDKNTERNALESPDLFRLVGGENH